MATENTRCRSCHAPIIWAITDKGHRMPLNPKPMDGGNIVLSERGQFLDPVAVYVKPDPNVKRYVSHFATCPESKKWRKRP